MRLVTISQFLFVLFTIRSVRPQVVQLTEQNFQDVVKTTELVLVNFYADWCHFSRQLAPIFDEAAGALAKEYSLDQIKLTRVDCENPQGQPLAQRFSVNKYPTLKLFRNGELVRREYRGSRSIDSIREYLRNEMKDPIDYAPNVMQVLKFDDKNRHIVVLVKSGDENAQAQNQVVENVKKLARSLKDDCRFHAFVGTLPTSLVGDDPYKVRFISPVHESFVDFGGNAENFNDLEIWVREKCIPLVREITFENAEELTEEGIPFLILFHDPEDKQTIKLFTEEVRKQLPDQRGLINPVYADGHKFSHPLSHLGKSAADLPVLAIDSFKHMYIFPFEVSTQLGKPGLLRQFVLDLHSGKLHREFHQGPDPTQAPQLSYDPSQDHQHGGDVPVDGQPPHQGTTEEPHIPKSKAGDEDDAMADYDFGQVPQGQGRTDPPESMFAKLAPSRLRYSMARDEL